MRIQYPLLSTYIKVLNLIFIFEIEITQEVVRKFGPMQTNEVIRASHDEKAWMECHADKKIISYKKYGFDLRGLN